MSTTKKIILVIGLAWCGICALFPPREYTVGVSDARIIPTHEFLFSPDFQIFHYQQGLGNYYSVDVNGGRLLAELVLIAVITGIVFLWADRWADYIVREFRAMRPNLESSRSPRNEVRTPPRARCGDLLDCWTKPNPQAGNYKGKVDLRTGPDQGFYQRSRPRRAKESLR